MRVAALYDVHGNLPALEAVLEEVEREGVVEIVFGGDIAAGPFPTQTLELVRSLDAKCIRGNADHKYTDAPDSIWVWEELSEADVAWLETLPPELVLGDALFVHAAPGSDEEIITPATSDERLSGLLEGIDHRLVVGGHTHMQQDRHIGEIRFINPGSVGMPYEHRPGAYWAIVGEDVEFRRTEFDLAAAAEAIRASAWPIAEEFARENVLTVPTPKQATAVFGG